jgi:hypothetical protein
MIKKLLHITACLFLTGFFIMSCKKEYSFEGSRPPVLLLPDTIKPILPSAPWICPTCIGKDVQLNKKWSFYIDSSFFCGDIDTAIVAPSRNGFTFFGPYSCSVDSGMVFSVFLNNEVLNKDLSNVTTRTVSFYYYDNIGYTFPYFSSRSNPFTFTIERYVHQTRTATGYFSGLIVRPNGVSSKLHSENLKYSCTSFFPIINLIIILHD